MLLAEFAYNNALHESTKNSPFFFEYRRHPLMGILTSHTKKTELQKMACNHIEAQEQAQAALALAAKHMKWYYDQEKREPLF